MDIFRKHKISFKMTSQIHVTCFTDRVCLYIHFGYLFGLIELLFVLIFALISHRKCKISPDFKNFTHSITHKEWKRVFILCLIKKKPPIMRLEYSFSFLEESFLMMWTIYTTWINIFIFIKLKLQYFCFLCIYHLPFKNNPNNNFF